MVYWEHFHHQADIGVRGCGDAMASAFEQAALGMTAVITDPDSIADSITVPIHCRAPDRELLLCDWLNALIYEMGTLGSGNHYLEVQEITEIFEPTVADAFGIKQGDILVSIHCGSRGLGHQIGTEFLKLMVVTAGQHGIQLPDRELACAPIHSKAGRAYLGAIRAGINCALANRQIITHLTRRAFERVLPQAELSQRYSFWVSPRPARSYRSLGECVAAVSRSLLRPIRALRCAPRSQTRLPGKRIAVENIATSSTDVLLRIKWLNGTELS